MRNEPRRVETSALIEQVLEVPFYIPATGAATRPRRTLKQDDTFVVLDTHGDIGAAAGGPDGVFDRDTRFLSRLELLLNDAEPLLLGSNLRDDNLVLTVDLTNPDMYLDNHLVLQKDTLHILRTLFVWRSTLYQRISIRNHCERRVKAQLAFRLNGDFVDIFEVRGAQREARGDGFAVVDDEQTITFNYRGLDDVLRRTRISFHPKPDNLKPNQAEYWLDLQPGDPSTVFICVQCDPEIPPRPFASALLAAHHASKAETAGITTVETSNEVFNEVLCRSIADLYMLVTQTPEGPYPYAGIPWYSTTFGRDGIITAIETLWFDPRIARGVLRRLAAFQARDADRRLESEPGKILHEMRRGEMAALNEVPFGLYYGSVDSTPLFLLLAGLYFERTGDVETLRTLWPAIEAALKWVDQDGDRDGDGFIEYQRSNESGLSNQGWKDSGDAVFHADGRLAQSPIALAEVQGYVYGAKRTIAECARALGLSREALRLDKEAATLAERFEDAFWCEDLETYALALDRYKEPCQVRTSNAGHLLFTGIAAPDRARLIANGLLRPRFFSGWGIRTVAADEARYNPMSYHNGSVWPHDNAIIALGFARYGLSSQVEPIFTGLFEAAAYMDLRRLPELFCGFRRGRGRGPTLYPVACSPQAWASGAPLLLLRACLGLKVRSTRNEIELCAPYLPAFLDDVLIRNLQVGSARVDLAVRRKGKDVGIQLARSDGATRLVVVPA